MTIGVVSFIAGLVTFNYGNTQEKTIKEKIEPDKISVPTSVESEKTDKQLKNIIDMAIADGVLTNKERILIKKFAEDHKLNYDSIIQDVVKKNPNLKNDSEPTLKDKNKKTGDDFEKYIVQKFDKEHFKILEWAGDKYVGGRYAQTTLQPDLLMELRLYNKKEVFSVECKYRNDFFKNTIEFSTPEQFKRYQTYETQKNIPVFIAFGIGGNPDSPKHLYIVPLKKINSNVITRAEIVNYEKKEIEKGFFYDCKTKELK